MYKITLMYQSDIHGEYTQEIGVSEDLQKAKYKRAYMINKWFDKLCHYIDFSNYLESIRRPKAPYTLTDDEITDAKLRMISRHIDDANDIYTHNTPRYFTIDIIKNCK